MPVRGPVIICAMVENSLEIKVGELLRPLGLKLAVAESCTGGLVGHRVTNVPGSSEYFLGGVTAYAYEAKVKLLGVSWDTLTRYGAVSRETVLEMARGARSALEADVGVSVSGIAGPGGGMPGKPVGLTWIGLSASDFEEARSFVFPGDRLAIKEQAAEQALGMLKEYLEKIFEKQAKNGSD
jgi:PncC family amidohydrolase